MKRMTALVVAAVFAMTILPQDGFAASRGHARAGVTAGFTSSSAKVKEWNANSVGRYHFGFTAQLPIALGFAIQPSILYQAKGTKLNFGEAEISDVNATVSYLEIPVQVQWGPDLVAFRPYIFAEPFVGYGLKAKAKSSFEGVSEKTTSFEKAGLARWEYGLGLGAGVDIWKLQASIKYYWNLGSLYNENGKMNNVGAQIKDAFKDGKSFNGVTISIAYLF